MSENDYEARLKRLEKDMWYGNGKPGITTRMAVVERNVEVMKQKLDEMVLNTKETVRNSQHGKWILIGVAAGVFGQIVLYLLHIPTK